MYTHGLCLQQLFALPLFPPTTKATNQTEGDSGMGSLGRNIEFMFLKVAELETIVELQQAQIMSLTDRLNAVENKTGLVQKDWGLTSPEPIFRGCVKHWGGWTRLDQVGCFRKFSSAFGAGNGSPVATLKALLAKMPKSLLRGSNP